MFSQKTSLYEDPNESLMSNGHGSSLASSASFNQFASNSYQTQDTDQFRESSPSGYGSGLTHNPLSNETKAQMNSSPSASRSKSSKKNSVTTTTSFVSREEKTLLDLEAEFN